MERLKSDHIKRLITLTSDYIKRLSMYSTIFCCMGAAGQWHQMSYGEGSRFNMKNVSYYLNGSKAKSLYNTKASQIWL